MDWNPWFTWSGLDKFKTVFIPIIRNNLYAGSNGLRPRKKKKKKRTYIPSRWIKVLWVIINFRIHMDSSTPDQNFPSFRYDVAWKQKIVVRHNKSKSKWKTDTCGLENIKHY